MKQIFTLSLFVLLASISSSQTKISGKDAAKHIGQIVIVSDKVYHTKSIDSSSNIILFLGGDDSSKLLTVLVLNRANSKFQDQPDNYFNGREVSVTGNVINNNGRPEIVVSNPSLVKFNFVDNNLTGFN